MAERRKRRNKQNNEQYNKLQKIIRRKVRQGKGQWIKEECVGLEKLESKHDTVNLRKKLKYMSGLRGNTCTTINTDEDEKLIANMNLRKELWKNYANELFQLKS